MVKNMVRMYFLRIYGAELSKSARIRRTGGFGPYGEAVYQTVLIVVMPIAGLLAAAIVLLPVAADGILTQHRVVLTAGASILTIVGAYLRVRKMTAEYARTPQAALSFSTRRDRVVCQVQFWCVLLGSIALPWIAFGVTRIAGE